MREVFADDGLNLSLSGEVVRGHGSEESLLTAFAQRLLRDPLDAVEPLLEDIVGAGNEVGLLP